MNLKEMYHIENNSPVPKYYQIKQGIIHAIKNNIYKEGDKIPTELEFCEALDVSRPTIRQALQELINEGYITRKKAKGTFVSKPKVEGFFFKKLESYNDEMRSIGLTPKTVVLKQEVITPNEEIKKILHLEENEQVLELIRLRHANDEPMVFVTTYVPVHLFPEIIDEDFSKENVSLYELFKKYHSPLCYVDRSVEAKNASKDLARLLSINENDAIYTISTIAYNAHDNPIEYSIANYRGDRNKFSIRLVQQ